MAYQKKEYVSSDAVAQAQQALQNQQAGKPGQYQSQWQGQMNALLGQLQGREKFRYDLYSDALYRQYKDQYVRQGRQAMMDTMGQAAALTGGYGNSYAQTAGQQVYGTYLQGLQDRIPELYGLALQAYQLEGDALKDQYELLADREAEDYSRYRDRLSDWSSETERLYQQFLQERSFDYGQFRDGQEFDYGLYRDSVEDQQWQTSLDYQKQQDKLSYEQWLQEFQYQQEQDRLAYEQWLREFQEDQRRYDQEWAAAQAKGSSRGSGGSTKKTDSEDTRKAQTFVENMLNNATSSRFDPERVISGTNALTDAQKQEAQKYLQTVLAAGRMK